MTSLGNIPFFGSQGGRGFRTGRGAPATQISAGRVLNIDPNPDLSREEWFGNSQRMGIAKRMQLDPFVRQSIDIRTQALLEATLDFEETSQDPIDLEIAAFARWAFFNTPLKFQQVMSEAHGISLAEGVALFETLDHTVPVSENRFPNHPGDGVGIVPASWELRPGFSIEEWHQNPKARTQITSVLQRTTGGDTETGESVHIPAKRLLRFTYEQEAANFDGFARLRSAYGVWKSKIVLQIVQIVLHERQGSPTAKIRIPGDELSVSAAEVEAAEIIGAEIRSSERGYVTLPTGYDLEWGPTSADVGDALRKAISDTNLAIMFNVTGAGSVLGLTGDGGSYNLAEIHANQFGVALSSDSRFLLDVINHGSDGWSPVRRLIDQNYGSQFEAPRLVMRNLPTKPWLKLAPVMVSAVQAGLLIPDASVRALLREGLGLGVEDGDALEQATRMRAPVGGGAMPQGDES